jgi:segregation and condensation protein B
MIRLLLSRNLIAELGKRNVPGKPMQYGTTSEFLKYFKLDSIEDLPKLDEIESARFSKPETPEG